LVAQYGIDATRFLLLSQFRFGSDGDIRLSAMAEQYEAHLVNGLGNLVARTAKMIEQYCEGQVDRTLELDQRSTALVQQYHDEMAKLHLHGALTTIQSFVSAIDEEIDTVRPWALVKTDEAAVRAHLSRWAKSLEALADLVEPFMPETGKRIRETFSVEKITKGEALFPRKK
jgi:methionyl-tRNA synthetase